VRHRFLHRGHRGDRGPARAARQAADRRPAVVSGKRRDARLRPVAAGETEIAQVRGHDGYGFPKWVTEIDVDIDAHRTIARVANDDGGTDIAIDVATPRQKKVASGTQVSTLTSYTELGGGWNATLSQTNTLAAGSRLLPKDTLQLGSGRLTDDVRSLEPIKAMRLDVVTECQNALHIPVPVSLPAK